MKNHQVHNINIFIQGCTTSVEDWGSVRSGEEDKEDKADKEDKEEKRFISSQPTTINH
ncbi:MULTISPECIES: hypothetical protein [Fischerella]|uniref:hypothetical protein n=1 Tax=Fischerella TaxID=1190 RepID=UPI0002DF8005|nr:MULTISPECIES: hypothetical protein [Fischerella]MBD2433894.1 hypothetical protein [Fischerella sp. FACHB-380]